MKTVFSSLGLKEQQVDLIVDLVARCSHPRKSRPYSSNSLHFSVNFFAKAELNLDLKSTATCAEFE